MQHAVGARLGAARPWPCRPAATPGPLAAARAHATTAGPRPATALWPAARRHHRDLLARPMVASRDSTNPSAAQQSVDQSEAVAEGAVGSVPPPIVPMDAPELDLEKFNTSTGRVEFVKEDEAEVRRRAAGAAGVGGRVGR